MIQHFEVFQQGGQGVQKGSSSKAAGILAGGAYEGVREHDKGPRTQLADFFNTLLEKGTMTPRDTEEEMVIMNRLKTLFLSAKFQSFYRALFIGWILCGGLTWPWPADLRGEVAASASLNSLVVGGNNGDEQNVGGEGQMLTAVPTPGAVPPRAVQTVTTLDRIRSLQVRDPFVPLKIPSTPSPPRPSRKTEKPAPPHPTPPGKLLSVVHGPDGFQAVIQLPSKKRVIVEPGGLLEQSGWLIKEITEDRVLLEYTRIPSALKKSSSPPKGVLSFQ